MSVLILCLIALLVILIRQWLQKWSNPKCKGRLPPGSMGLPIIGETIQFFSPHSFYGIPPFIRKRITKYGLVFKTSLVGNLVVVSGDPELNQYIFKEEGKSVYCSYTQSAIKILGEQSLLAYHGVIHKYLKNLTLSMIGPESLKEVLLQEMDTITRKHLHSCSNYTSFDVKEESANMVFKYFAKKLFSYEEVKALKKLRENYKAFLDGFISFPLNIPGTAFHACLKGRENAIQVIKDVISERKSSMKPYPDFLDFLLEETKKEDTILNEGIIVDLVFVLLFASYETTSEAVCIICRYTKMENCLTPLPEVGHIKDIAGGMLTKWPERLTSVPPRIMRGSVKGITAKIFREDTDKWKKRVTYYKGFDGNLAVSGRYRNILDMNAYLGGFAAALIKDPVWVMNMVPVEAEINTLGIIYERGLIGTYQNWCEAMSTYPRTYDFIHADSVFTLYKDRCEMEDILLEMDRILRPGGTVILRDDVDMVVKIQSITDRLNWNSRIVDHEEGPHYTEKILWAAKQYWTAAAADTDHQESKTSS